MCVCPHAKYSISNHIFVKCLIIIYTEVLSAYRYLPISIYLNQKPLSIMKFIENIIFILIINAIK